MKLKNLVLVGEIILVTLIGACASKEPNLPVWGTLTLERAHIVEVHEAFKNANSDKSIELENLGEATCAYKQCVFPLKVKGPVEGRNVAKGSREVSGKLIFSKASSDAMVSLMDQARETAKEQSTGNKKGRVSCKQQTCTLAFWMREGGEVAVDSLFAK